MRTVVWFTLDLRLLDHPALRAANEAGEIVPLFILDPHDPWFPGGANQWWLHHSLASLQQQIKEQGGQLILRRGDTLRNLAEICAACNAAALYFSRGYEPWSARLQKQVHAHFSKCGLEVKRFGGRMLLEPDSVLTKQERPYQVFTPFYREASKGYHPGEANEPKALNFYRGRIASDELTQWQLLPGKPNWAESFDKWWQPGEAGAHEALQDALDGTVKHYDDTRDLPAQKGTSRLSPHLHLGELSPRQVWRAVAKVYSGSEAQPYLRQLFWREFGLYLLHHFPHTDRKPFNDKFRDFPWRHNKKRLRDWQNGQTGYPIVDAGMRELWQTGWMHNRVRMIVASFLTKDLNIPWVDGAAWFWDTLVDADLGNNSMGWQWVAGCGADAAPYFRIFNPVLQGEKFDPEGHYVRQWVPELAKLGKKHIHKPWEASEEELEQAGIRLGSNYPEPMIDHKSAREEALTSYRRLSG